MALEPCLLAERPCSWLCAGSQGRRAKTIKSGHGPLSVPAHAPQRYPRVGLFRRTEVLMANAHPSPFSGGVEWRSDRSWSIRARLFLVMRGMLRDVKRKVLRARWARSPGFRPSEAARGTFMATPRRFGERAARFEGGPRACRQVRGAVNSRELRRFAAFWALSLHRLGHVRKAIERGRLSLSGGRGGRSRLSRGRGGCKRRRGPRGVSRAASWVV